MFYFLMLFLAPMVLAEETTYASAGCTIISTDAHQELQCKNLNLQGRLYLTDVPIDIGKLNLAQNNLTSLDPRTITPLIRAIRGTVDLSDNPYFFLFFFPDLSDAFWSIFLFFSFFIFLFSFFLSSYAPSHSSFQFFPWEQLKTFVPCTATTSSLD